MEQLSIFGLPNDYLITERAMALSVTGTKAVVQFGLRMRPVKREILRYA
jgi:hypothetical protein